MAHVFAVSFHRRRFLHRRGPGSVTKRKVGKSLKWRVDMLQGLPEGELAHHAAVVKRDIQAVERLPWCLTHGDLVPSNILVDPETGSLTGLVDWAEGEWLPLGTGLYGLEELLCCETGAPGSGFKYFDNHEDLRQIFWSRFLCLCGDSSELEFKPRLKEVQLARELGIMLWRGIAFDDGRIDRVVQAGRDDAELQKLRLFLSAPSGLEVRDLGLQASWDWLLRILCLWRWRWIWMWICWSKG